MVPALRMESNVNALPRVEYFPNLSVPDSPPNVDFDGDSILRQSSNCSSPGRRPYRRRGMQGTPWSAHLHRHFRNNFRPDHSKYSRSSPSSPSKSERFQRNCDRMYNIGTSLQVSEFWSPSIAPDLSYPAYYDPNAIDDGTSPWSRYSNIQMVSAIAPAENTESDLASNNKDADNSDESTLLPRQHVDEVDSKPVPRDSMDSV
jgi:hypothetical protein